MLHQCGSAKLRYCLSPGRVTGSRAIPEHQSLSWLEWPCATGREFNLRQGRTVARQRTRDTGVSIFFGPSSFASIPGFWSAWHQHVVQAPATSNTETESALGISIERLHPPAEASNHLERLAKTRQQHKRSCWQVALLSLTACSQGFTPPGGNEVRGQLQCPGLKVQCSKLREANLTLPLVNVVNSSAGGIAFASFTHNGKPMPTSKKRRPKGTNCQSTRICRLLKCTCQRLEQSRYETCR